MTDNYKIEKSIVTIPYIPNRDDRTDLFTDAGTKNQVISASNEGTDLTFTEFAEVFGVYDILDASSSQTGTISDMYII
tara:strand:+ start:59 stop:292 length:234 start_codon:yes stop_codon:yes gene_type:complete